MFLWLFRELGFSRRVALLAALIALWSPYRSEIWTSLTLSEGVAMPYAIGALVCAIRGARSPRPWPWDLAGIVCCVAALGCKNTFVALIPTQMVLELARIENNEGSKTDNSAVHGRHRGRRAGSLVDGLSKPRSPCRLISPKFRSAK